MNKSIVTTVILLLIIPPLLAQELNNKANTLAEKLESKMIAWRRDFHQNPELSNREFNTSKKIADHLKQLGIEVKTGVAKTGVIGVLKGAHPGPVIALRADMDALPVTERAALPFASKVVSEYNGQKTGVMHACGHDTHIAILMATASILSELKSELHGTVKFIFQPAEEGPPPGETGGASLMVAEGVMENPAPEVIFGLHSDAGSPLGQICYKPEGFMAASDRFEIIVKGKQAHGSAPWGAVDPIAISAQIINGLQYIISRNAELTKEPAVVTVGMVQAGVRYNIIPEEAKLVGTIRTLDEGMRKMIHEKIKATAIGIAEVGGGTAEVEIVNNAPLTYNDPQLIQRMLPSFEKAAGKEKVVMIKPVTGAEDFSYFHENIPGLYFFVGMKPENQPYIRSIYGHHTPDFIIDEKGMIVGLKAMLNLTIDYMTMK